MIKTLVAVTFGLFGAAMISGCVVRSEPAVVVRPAPAVVYTRPAPAVVYTQPAPVVVYTQPAVVVPAYKYKHKGKGNGAVIVVH